MLLKLLEYNWNVFKSSLTRAKITVLVIYGAWLLLVFSNVLMILFSIIYLQNSPELYEEYQWLSPDRAEFILLAFANILWAAQFIFTNIRQLQLPENRKLLSMGYPVHLLAKYLNLIGFFHPVNLIFNVIWFLFLYLQFPLWYYIPLIAAMVVLNYAVIFSLKLRFLKVFRAHQKWVLLFLTAGLLLIYSEFELSFKPDMLSTLDPYLSSINNVLWFLPGGLLRFLSDYSVSIFWCILLSIVAALGCFYLFRDHVFNTRHALQNTSIDEQEPGNGKLRAWLCSTFGDHAGKFLFYLTSHPYNRIQALMFVLLPVFYLPLVVGDNPENDMTGDFIILFFLMYVPLGFLMMAVGNMFGYENRELLLHLQFPEKLTFQINERFKGALIFPITAFIIVCIAEIIFFSDSAHLFSYMAGNVFIFLVLLKIFLKSSFAQYQKIPWISFSFTQPVVSQSTAMVSGLAMFILSLAIYIPYGSFELYKQIVLCVGILYVGFTIYHQFKNMRQSFIHRILPRLWTEL